MANVKIIDNRQTARIRTEKGLMQFMTRKALQIERAAKESMKGGGTDNRQRDDRGRFIAGAKKQDGPIRHVPSRPGEPPAVDTGRLRASITHEIQFVGDEIEARVGTNVVYGRFLELGTRHIEPRPWLRPAFMKVVGQTA